MEDPPAINEEEVMEVAAAMPPGERGAYLDTACRSHPDLRAWIEQRLAFAKEDIVKSSTIRIEPIEATEAARLQPEEAGNRLGNYKLLQQIGEGSFGTVWVAEQYAPVKRRVAFQIVKLGMDTKEVIARFEQERQALALMDHPNIAKVFDAGITESGRPYFVMELVRGIKITDYCDQSRLSTVDRLKLFISVCRAVQHAHQKGIIHRDIKPSNILVTLQDGMAVPKVIDFGVAKTMQQQKLTELTIFTYVEQMIGTPAYMSPEQADASGLDIDTRSDIYSLGVLLYELLTGQTPFDIKKICKGGMDEVRRVLREVEPKRPSTLLLTMAPDTRLQLAQRQQADDATLVGILRRDLDWIAMKALEKDRARRYATAQDLGSDVERYLNRQAILARPPSRRYRMRRFISRHKVGVASAVSIVTILVIGFAVSVSQAMRANRAAQRANELLTQLRDMAHSLGAEARELVLQGKFDEALKRLSFGISLYRYSADYLRDRAMLLLSQLKLSEATTDFREVLKIQPGNKQIRSMLALCERLDAMPKDPDGTLTLPAIADLYKALTDANRPKAELMPLAKALGKERDILLSFWLEKLRLLPDAEGKPLTERLKMGDDGLMELDLSQSKIADVGPLRGMPLRSLNLRKCTEIQSIEALRGMKLRKLDLTETNVQSLLPLRDSQTLEELDLKRTPIDNLEPLRGLPLRKLDVSLTKVRDLSPLKMMQLEVLEIGATKVTDLSPLSKLPLKMLECSFLPVTDYSALANTSIEQLSLQDAILGDLEILRKLPLKTLTLTGAREIRNFRILKEIKTLEVLVLPGNPLAFAESEIEAIESLRDHPSLKQMSWTLRHGSSATQAEPVRMFWQEWDAMMRWWRPLNAAGINMETERLKDGTWSIWMQEQPLKDLSAFEGARLSQLTITKCRDVRDLSPLRDLPLTVLRISHAAVDDLEPIANCKLRELWMAGTRVSDLNPLRGMPMARIFMDQCSQLSDVSPLMDLASLEEIVLPENATGVEDLKRLPKLRHISYTYDRVNERPACLKDDFFREYHALDWLRAMRNAKIPLEANQLADGTWRLKVTGAEFADLTMLKGARISELMLQGTAVTNLQSLQGIPLRKLRLDRTPCKDVSPLAKIFTLESLVLPSEATNVAALQKLLLKRLDSKAGPDGEPVSDAASFWNLNRNPKSGN